MTDNRKSIFLPQVSRSSSRREPDGQTWAPGAPMMEVLVYWTPFWSFTRINSTCFFSTLLYGFKGATDESLWSDRTWMFILAPARSWEMQQLLMMKMSAALMMTTMMMRKVRWGKTSPLKMQRNPPLPSAVDNNSCHSMCMNIAKTIMQKYQDSR